MRIELDDMQALAFEACSDNTQARVGEAADKAKQGQALLAEAKLMRDGAIERMERCWKTIASCHGLEEIPGEAQIDRADGRVVITWEEKPEEIDSIIYIMESGEGAVELSGLSASARFSPP